MLLSLELSPERMFVFIDGNDHRGNLEDIVGLFNSNQTKGELKYKNIQFIVQGDEIYPLINKADRIAYKIFKELDRNPNYRLKDREIKIPLLK